jgi:hypothetical protein
MLTFIEKDRYETLMALASGADVKLLYQWVKTGVVPVREFERLLTCLKK